MRSANRAHDANIRRPAANPLPPGRCNYATDFSAFACQAMCSPMKVAMK